jgi:signal transduction histidine kinase
MIMTISSQVKQTLASLKSAQANLESFALQTQNQNAKQLYSSAAQQTRSIVDSLEPRLTEIENEEPQYKGF